MTTDAYLYNDASRLTSLNGVTYNWDANGNLLNDGVNTYTYDSANHLKTMTGGVTYTYNGLGDRLRQTVNGVTTTYTLDLNAGLTQVLNDGTNSYIYGVDRIAQANASNGTEYFLGDALGSVRQLTNTSGVITYARAYDPYGVVTSTSGASQTPYSYTGEYSGDYNELLYLRSRFYSSSTGRFLTRDTWMGDSNRPLSLNRWMYVEGNPVNRVDPTGYSYTFPDWCQMMPTKGLYETCILSKYGLEPISIFELGDRVQGQQGCYSGPTSYRAPGYLEGIEEHFGGIPSYTTGQEIVYDFANMQRANFTFSGVTINDGLVGVGMSFYFGAALGLKSNTGLIQDYRDISFSGSVGGSFDMVIGGAIGRGGFVAGGSDTIPLLRGKTWYLGLSISGDLVEGLDLSGSWVNYTPTSNPTSYVNGNEIDVARLNSDIMTGIDSPWGTSQADLIYPNALLVKSAVRAYGIYLANKYVKAYKAMHNENP